jgi:hypothetical protein
MSSSHNFFKKCTIEEKNSDDVNIRNKCKSMREKTIDLMENLYKVYKNEPLEEIKKEIVFEKSFDKKNNLLNDFENKEN